MQRELYLYISKLELDNLGPLPTSLLTVCLTVDPCAYREIEVRAWLEKVFLHHKQSTHQVEDLELVSKELNHLAAILNVYAGGLNFMK